MTESNNVKSVKLKVAEAIQDDVNKGIIRIDSSYMKDIEVKPGDIVELEGERKTVGIVDRAYPGDIGLNIIRMDGIIRRNAKTGIGEMVAIRKVEIKEAKKVIIAPARKGIIVKASPVIFKQGLLGRAVAKGDIVSLGGSRRRRSTMNSSPFFDDVFSMLGDESLMGFGFGDLKFIVAETIPKGAVIVSDSTEIVFNPEAVELTEDKAPEVTYEDIGGLGEEVKKIREMVELPLKHPEIFTRLGIEPPKGVLLHGPPGTGKTLLAKAVANETNSNFILINGPEIMSKFYGQSEANLRKKFEDAEKNAPSIIFIDEIDAIAVKREESHGEVERRVVAQMLAIMDGLKSRGKVVVIAATNIPNSLDPALRRPGRFDREIEIGVPKKEGRLNILKIHTRNMPLLTKPESLNPKYESELILEEMKALLSGFDVKKFIEILPDANSKYEFKDISIPKVNVMLTGLIPKNSNSFINTFITDSISKLSEHIIDEAFNYAEYDNLRIKFTKELESEMKKKIEYYTTDDGTKDLLSRLVKEKILEEIAEVTHGFVGADLSALAKESAMVVLRRIMPDLKMKEEQEIPKEILEKLYITMKDFKDALKVVRPSALREVLIEAPDVKWDDIGGLEEVKQELKEAVEWPLKYPDSFKRLGVKPPKGILIYGPPGTGKTMLAKAVANETQSNFILVKGPELLSKWVGESEKAVREVFKKARQAAPTIIFFDEIDSLAPTRSLSQDSHVTERVVNQLLTEMDGLEEMNDVVIIAATNRPDMLDTALLRPGRFDRIVLTPAPDVKSREFIFKVHSKGMPLAKDVNIKDLAAKSEGYVGADIESVCREAAILALREDIKAKEVTYKHFEKALDKVRPSSTKDIEKAYAELKDHFSKAKARQMEEEKPGYFG